MKEASRRFRLSFWLRLLGVVVALFLFAYLLRAPMLTGLARVWVINEPLREADAIVILGGSLESRPVGAANLYKQGLAPKIVHMDVKWEPAALVGVGQSEPELTRQILLKSGVPELALFRIGHQVTSTWDESQALREWMQTNGVKRVIICTDLFHTRRVRWLFRRELKPAHAQFQVAAVENPHYGVTNWWQGEHGLIAFQNECIKLPYYWTKY